MLFRSISTLLKELTILSTINRNINIVKTGQYDTICTAKRIVILIVLLYIKSRIGLISRKREADASLSVRKGPRVFTLQAK